MGHIKLTSLKTSIIVFMSLVLINSCKAKNDLSDKTHKEVTIMQKDISNAQTGKFNDLIILKYGNVLEFEDGLKMKLTDFGHKSSADGKAVQAKAHLEIYINQVDKFENIAVNREEYTDEQGVLKSTYATTAWGDYNIELIGLSYGESIDIIVTQITDTSHAKTNNTKKGEITGKIIELPNKKKIESITISLNPDPETGYTKHLDSIGNFNSGAINYGTYTLQIFHEESHYPILIKNVVLDKQQLDLGELPLFEDPNGYQAEWGADADGGDPFHYRYPINEKQRASLETEYQMLFKNHFKDKQLNFETLDIDKNTTDNTTDSWRFSVIENK